MSSSKAPSLCLRVQGTDIVDGDGHRVILKGCATGGQTNMENFITGYPGHEHEVRRAMLDVMGKEKYDFFFEKFLDYFFTVEDAKFLASLGLNCVRVPFNHRHFMDDLNPSVIKPEGFRLLDRIVDACASAGIYTILDLHTFPGGQNQGWHSDSGIHRALFWEYKDLQDRATQLWVEIAKHYKGNTWIAGYNPMNEPADPEHSGLQKWYAEVEKAIRAVDPDHILFLDGNTYSMDFTGFKTILPNCVYAIHDYSNMGFPAGEPYTATEEQKQTLRKQYARKVEFMKEHKVPIWNGEFGPVYASPTEDPSVNEKRYNLLGEQLRVYREDKISWSIWLYKDIGFQGMVYTNPDSPYIKLLAPFLAKKHRLGLDKWGRSSTNAVESEVYAPLIEHLKAEIPEEHQRRRYPYHWGLEGHVHRVVRELLVSELMTYEFAEYFRGKSEEELDQLAASFKLENCVRRDGLNEILTKDAEIKE